MFQYYNNEENMIVQVAVNNDSADKLVIIYQNTGCRSAEMMFTDKTI